MNNDAGDDMVFNAMNREGEGIASRYRTQLKALVPRLARKDDVAEPKGRRKLVER